MFKAVGHPVIRLKRIQVGTLKLGNLSAGGVQIFDFGGGLQAADIIGAV